MVNGQNVHLPPSHNAQILVGDHFDHQPDNRNTLLCKSGGYHFGNHHIPVTFGANNAFHYPPHTCNSQRRMPMTTEQWERENQDSVGEIIRYLKTCVCLERVIFIFFNEQTTSSLQYNS